MMDKLPYAFAISMDSLRGYRRIGHGGGDAGYRTYAMRVPETGLGVVVFSNLGRFNPRSLADKVAALYLPDRSPKKVPTVAYKIDSTLYKDYKGLYHTLDDDFEVIDSGKLYLKFDNGPVALTPVSDSVFTVFDGRVRVTFVRDENGRVNAFRSKIPTA